MSERTTAKMVAELHADATWIVLPYPKEAARIHAAADRLADLDAALEAQIAIGADLARAAFADLLPPGVSIEQLVATYNAVWGQHYDVWADAFAYLRSVKP